MKLFEKYMNEFMCESKKLNIESVERQLIGINAVYDTIINDFKNIREMKQMAKANTATIESDYILDRLKDIKNNMKYYQSMITKEYKSLIKDIEQIIKNYNHIEFMEDR